MESVIRTDEMIRNKYRIRDRLGEGGMSIVYRAEDTVKSCPVAIKFLKPGKTSSYIEDIIRFKKEVELISTFHHPHIVKFYETGEYEGRPYLVTELIEGLTLSDMILGNQQLTVEQTIGIIKQLAMALNYVHGKGIIHRDIKPGNIAVKRENNEFQVKLLDFGLSLLMELSQIKDEKEIAGTFGYMSPEATGIIKKSIDERSDLYSLGIVFYTLLVGEQPFKGRDVGTLLHQQVAVLPPPPEQINHDVPSVVNDMVMKLLFKEPELRYQSAKGLLHDLELLEQGVRDFIIAEQDQKIKLTYQTRLIGREEEITKIRELFDRTSRNQGHICLIGGEPGVGKTRLVEALQEYAYKQGYEKGGMFIRGRCLNQENKMPYQPFRDALNEYIKKTGKLDEAAKDTESKRLKSLLGDLANLIIQLNPNMRDILGETPELTPLEPEKENQRFLMLVSDFFCNLADEEHVCILFLDDLQWADEGSLRLLEEISRKLRGYRFLVLGTYRENEVGEDHSLSRIIKKAGEEKLDLTDMKLKQLNKPRLNKLTAEVLGEKEERAVRLTDYVFEKSNGNPFFAITLLRELVEQKALVWEQGYWKEDWEKIRGLRIPLNIIDMVLLKIKDIPSRVDHLLRLGSVIGREFEMDLLYSLMEMDKESVVSLVDEAIDKQLLEHSVLEKGKVLFIHDRIKEAFFARMGPEEIAGNHLKIGLAMEQRYRDREEEIIFDLAHHFIEGGDEERGLTYGLKAAQKAKDNYANKEAIKYFGYAKKVLVKKGERSERYVELLEGLGDVLRLEGIYDEALKNFREASGLVKDELDKGKIFNKIGDALFQTGQVSEATQTLEKTIGILGFKPTTSSGLITMQCFMYHFMLQKIHVSFPGIFIHDKFKDDERSDIVSRIYIRLGYCYYFDDKIRSALVTLRGLNISDRMHGSIVYSHVHIVGSTFWVAIGMFSSAEKYIMEGLKAAMKLKNKLMEGFAYTYLCYTYMASNRLKESIEYGQKGVAMLLPLGEKWEISTAYAFIFWSCYMRGELTKAKRINKENLQQMEHVKDPRTLSWAIHIDTKLDSLLKGVDEDVIFRIQKSLDHQISVGEAPHIAMTYATMAMHYTKKGDYDKAVQAGEEGVKVFLNTTAKGFWALEVFAATADAYLKKIKEEKISGSRRRRCLRRVKFLCHQSLKYSRTYKAFQGFSMRVLAKYYWLKGNKGRSIRCFLKGIRFMEKHEHLNYLAQAYYELGKLLYREGYNFIYNAEKGKEYLIKAKELFEKMEVKPDLEKTMDILGLSRETNSEEITPQERLSLERRMNTVLNTSRYLSSILELDELLEKIMDSTVELVGAERGALFLYPEKDEKREYQLELKVVKNVKKEGSDQFLMSQSIINRVLGEKKPVIIDDASSDIELKNRASVITSGFKSIICSPIITKGEMIGIVYLDNNLVSGLFSQEDMKVLELITSQAGISIENARLYKKAIEKERMEQDLAIASTIQKMFLPEYIEPIKNVSLNTYYLPSDFIGGDYYDVVKLDDHRHAILIVDIAGHGSSAAIVMSVISFIVHSAADKVKDSTELAGLLNKRLVERLKGEKFATGIIMIYDEKTETMEYINAGHPGLLLYKKSEDKLLELETRSLPIGLEENAQYKKEEFQFAKDDIILLLTDGVYETKNKNRNLYTFDRIRKLLWNYREKGAREINASIIAELERFREGLGQEDDITLITLKKT
ncbi:MAG: SpoIIE family protein phosphatase [bacterium]|nr:SpoIIE family protein phosphatase [bacterium]